MFSLYFLLFVFPDTFQNYCEFLTFDPRKKRTRFTFLPEKTLLQKIELFLLSENVMTDT